MQMFLYTLSYNVYTFLSLFNKIITFVAELLKYTEINSLYKHFFQFFYTLLLWQFNIMTESMFFILYQIAQMLALGFDQGSGETLLQEKNFSGYRWNSNPGPCRQYGHCRKHARPLRHLDLVDAYMIIKKLQQARKIIKPNLKSEKCS